MFKKWRLTDRTRTLLTLELAIVLPAAALLGFSIWNLKHIQRSEAFEAASQRDFSHVLHIAEKKTWHKAGDLINPARKEFPRPDQSRDAIKAQLLHVLSEHPEFAYGFLYDKDTNLLQSAIQPVCHDDAESCAHAEEAIKSGVNMAASWLPLECPELVNIVRINRKKSRY